jgi:hypothetical protein
MRQIGIRRRLRLLPLLLGIGCLAGCSVGDSYREVAEVAQQAADRQAAQNAEMVQLNREVAEGTERLVAADAAARTQIVQVHHELQAERATLHDGFDTLEAERQQIAYQRNRESLLAQAFSGLALALVAALVLGFCWTLLFGLRHDEATDGALNELLVRNLAGDRPLLPGGFPTLAIAEEDPSTPDPQRTTEGNNP